MRTRLITSLLLILAAPLLLAQTPQKPAPSQPATRPLGELAVVSTWDQLEKQPAFQIDGQDYRFGIESDTCSANTGILVYCLPAKAPGQLDITGSEGEPLGPAYVNVVSQHDIRKMYNRSGNMPAQANRPIFYATAARVNVPGEYEIQIINRRGDLLQRKKIEVTKAQDLPWLLLNHPEAKGKQEAGASYQLFSEAGVPHWNGLTPRDKNDKLPKFLEAAEDPALEVSVERDAGKTWIKVKSAKWISDDIPGHCLIRFWVNDKPITKPLGNGEGLQRRARNEGTKIKEPVEFRFQLDIDRKLLGAAPKDKIEFQLLYSSDGVDAGQAESAMHATSLYPGIKLSNRIQWLE